MFVVIKSWPELKMGHVRSNTRSLDQFLEKPYVLSRRHSFNPIFMKLCQNVRCYKNLGQNEKWAMSGQKTRSLGLFLEKPCVLSRRHIFYPVFMNLCQNDFLILNRHLSRRAVLSDDSSC